MTSPEAHGPVETEAKFDASLAAFRALDRLESVAGWRAAGRRDVRLRDTYWDTPDHQLGRAGCTLRVRELDGGPTGELTYKGASDAAAGGRASARLELVAPAPAGSTPAGWARLPEARQIVDLLARQGVLDRLRPDVVLLNPRREVVLRRGGGNERSDEQADEVVLSLDTVEIEDQPYRRRYVELELRRGSRGALDALVDAVAEHFRLRPSRRGKVRAARDWLSRRQRRLSA